MAECCLINKKQKIKNKMSNFFYRIFRLLVFSILRYINNIDKHYYLKIAICLFKTTTKYFMLYFIFKFNIFLPTYEEASI